MRYVVFDIETTGLDFIQNNIIEIGAVKVEDGVVIDEFDQLLNPLTTISPEVSAINHITNEMIESADYSINVLNQFKQFISDCDILIGHNAIRFDWPFLKEEMRKHGIKLNEKQVLDTVRIARSKIKMRSYSLASLCSHPMFQIENKDAHRALSDVYATFELFEKLKEL